MKGKTEIKLAQYLERWYSFRIFRIVWDRLVLDPSRLKSIQIPLKKLGLIPIPFPAERCHAESIPTAIPVN